MSVTTPPEIATTVSGLRPGDVLTGSRLRVLAIITDGVYAHARPDGHFMTPHRPYPRGKAEVWTQDADGVAVRREWGLRTVVTVQRTR